MSVQLEDLELLDAVRNYTLEHAHPDIERFKAAVRDWGDNWVEREPRRFPAADLLAEACAQPDCHELMQCFARHQHRLCWEQSYTRADALVPAAMLDDYTFAEVIGKHGPFESERIRAGICIWGPGIDYPRH